MASRNYFQVKKHRMLKRKAEALAEKVTGDNCSDCAGPSTSRDVHLNAIENSDEDVDYLSDDCNEDMSIASDDSQTTRASSNEKSDESIPCSHNSAVPSTGMHAKVRDWALRNSSTLRLNVISEILVILREEGYVSLPKMAQTLLGTTHRRELQVMASATANDGEYAYLGIEHGLRKIICSDIYRVDTISAIIHIDGMQVYKSSPTTTRRD